MADQLQLRRGTTAQIATFTGAQGEVIVDTDKDTLVVQDGATAGGFPVATSKELVNGTFYYDDATSSGSTANAYILSPKTNTNTPTSYQDGQQFGFVTANSNTGPSTANFVGLGALSLKWPGGIDPSPGEISGRVYLVYNQASNWFEIQNVKRSVKTLNVVINGAFNINQRAVTGTVTLAAGAYGHDRWKAGASGCTYTFATSANVTTITITAGSLQQVIEGTNLQSGTYTLSWAGTAQGKIGAGSFGASGITGGVTGGANLTIEFNTGTLSTVQLEAGSVATAFEWRNYGYELFLCMRYGELVTTGWITGFSPAISVLNLQWRVPKRVAPTLALVAGGAGVGNGISIGITAISGVTASVDGAFTSLTGGVAWTAAASYSWRDGSIFVSSEL